MRNGFVGTRPRAISAADTVSSSMPSAMWTTGARRAGSADQGIGASSADLLTALETDADGSAAAYEDPLHAGVAGDRPAVRLEPPHERGGEPTGAAARERKADVLAEHRQEPAEEGARRRLGREVGVGRVARNEARRPVAAEVLVGELPERQHSQAHEAEQIARPESHG